MDVQGGALSENQSVNSMEAAQQEQSAEHRLGTALRQPSTGWGQQAAEGFVWGRMDLPESRSATAASPALLMGDNTGRR